MSLWEAINDVLFTITSAALKGSTSLNKKVIDACNIYRVSRRIGMSKFNAIKSALKSVKHRWKISGIHL